MFLSVTVIGRALNLDWVAYLESVLNFSEFRRRSILRYVASTELSVSVIFDGYKYFTPTALARALPKFFATVTT